MTPSLLLQLGLKHIQPLGRRAKFLSARRRDGFTFDVRFALDGVEETQVVSSGPHELPASPKYTEAPKGITSTSASRLIKLFESTPAAVRKSSADLLVEVQKLRLKRAR